MAVENFNIAAPGLSAQEITQRLNGLIQQLEGQFGNYISNPQKQIDFSQNKGLIQANIFGHDLATSFAAGNGMANFNVSVPDSVAFFIRKMALERVKDTLISVLSR
jgi:hypothetical protein